MKKFFKFFGNVGAFVFISAGLVGTTLAGFGLAPWSLEEAGTVAIVGLAVGGICSLLEGDSGFDGSYRDGNDV